MLKIKIYGIEKHRAETTFRPYLFPNVRKLFHDVGIEFTTLGNDFDLLWVAQPAYMNRHYIDYKESLEKGLKFLNRQKHHDVIMFDGSDSPSLKGSWDVFKNSHSFKLIKNSLYKDKTWYKKDSCTGRYYWGESDVPEHNFKIDDEIDFENDVILSGCNWLSTLQPLWFDYSTIAKDWDVCALFSCPAKQNFEWGIEHSLYYDKFREKFLAALEPLEKKFKIKTLEQGQHLPTQEYYSWMQRSKIILAPFGYGEIAPRDIESATLGSILMKPDMSHIETLPNPYNQTTYVDINWDGSNIAEKIELIVGDFKASQEHYVENMRREYVLRFKPENLVLHTYNWIKTLPGYGTT